jgi:hypothetical protein
LNLPYLATAIIQNLLSTQKEKNNEKKPSVTTAVIFFIAIGFWLLDGRCQAAYRSNE